MLKTSLKGVKWELYLARPHPGLLPPEKENRSPSLFQFTVTGLCATVRQTFKDRPFVCPLLGERNQVRAGVRNQYVSIIVQFPGSDTTPMNKMDWVWPSSITKKNGRSTIISKGFSGSRITPSAVM